VAAVSLLAGAGVVSWNTYQARANEQDVRDSVAIAEQRGEMRDIIDAQNHLGWLQLQHPILEPMWDRLTIYPQPERSADAENLRMVECAAWLERAKQPKFDMIQAQERASALPECRVLATAITGRIFADWQHDVEATAAAFLRLASPQTCGDASFAPEALESPRGKIHTLLADAPEGGTRIAGEVEERIQNVERECQAAQNDLRERDAAARLKDTRDDEMNRLTTRYLDDRNDLIGFVEGLSSFLDDRAGRDSADQSARVGLTRAALQKVSILSQEWGEMPRRAPQEVVLLRQTVSNLPADVMDEKEAFLKEVTKIANGVKVRQACSRFEDVNAQYEAVSRNILKRTDGDIATLRDSIKELRNDPFTNEHVGPALEAMNQATVGLETIVIGKITLTLTVTDGQLSEGRWIPEPGQGLTDIIPTDWVPPTAGTFTATSNRRQEVRNSSKPVAATFQWDEKTLGSDPEYKISENVTRASLLEGATSAQSPDRAISTTSRTLTASMEGHGPLALTVTYSLSLLPGPTITAESCPSR